MLTHRESIIDQFTRQAIHFSQIPGRNNEESLRLLMDMAGVLSNDRVIDIACGSGIVACAFATVAGHVTGVDITPAMLEQARLMARERNLTNLTWLEGDIEKLPFPDNSFSIVLSRYAFHHFLRPDMVLSEMVRVCMPGGKILIVDAILPADKVDAYNNFEKLIDPSHTRALTTTELQDLVSGAGLQNIRLGFYKMEMDLEKHLAASYPNPGDADRIRQLVREDLGVNRIGIGAYLSRGEIHFAYPITILVAEKEST